jgi:two-component sensor histidine kinase/CheY-like chemotaxis protein
MSSDEKVNILLVDDQPAKLMSYEVVLRDLGENLIKAESAAEALEILLKNEIALVLVDVCMPELDGFELAAMIRDHPRFQRTAIIFISAIHLAQSDYLRGYEMGGVDYVPVPVVPELLRAKVRVFADLYRKTRELEVLNKELETRVAERTAELEASSNQLRESERSRSIALAAGQMGSLQWELESGACFCDDGQCRIFGIDPSAAQISIDTIRPLVDEEDFAKLQELIAGENGSETFQTEIRVVRSPESVRSCICAAALTRGPEGRPSRVSIVMIDITERKQAEDRQLLLAREVDHRARNALAVVQSIVRLTRADNQQTYVRAIEGRIHALAQAHTLLSESRWQGADLVRIVGEELAPYRVGDGPRVSVNGASVILSPEKAQNIALAVHELATNSAKYGALSVTAGALDISWESAGGVLTLRWQEANGPLVRAPSAQGFGTRIMNASIKHQIGGHVFWDWRPTGLHCTIQIPDPGQSRPKRQEAVHGQENLVQLPTGCMKRVLLVEDDAIIGMMMRELLAERGLFVVGPCCSVREALAVVRDDLDCAILDVHLGAEYVYPVASTLQELNVPFAFVSGYGRESIDSRFQDVFILQKPVTREGLDLYLNAVLGADYAAGVGPAMDERNPSAALRA